MKVAKINKYQFKYDDGNMFCFEDSDNNKIAFINGSEIQLVIDINNNRLTFHPSQSVNIYELDEYTYKIESFF
ncbi:hypothetical protein FD06_GL000683 [Apilactobacillus ozensis DSM 23829 = JCM 17196]|uniref:Uncharacterized protein n=1 Tax=Apilactobacillus ozensis DSM 23829 = JCM 17196 TaxID=1423781 RepID=A0A0R2AXC6_9LACO|nr:hypothetical protein [Apilactobacillus ozensis]KRM67532.1 hypothetical protein FD06_GL000683 [Apilactobacillus ozensis DSM 23829 = JCM 17196]